MKNLLKAVGGLLACVILALPGVATADNITFNYQGRVKVQSQPFDGIGLIKLAILNTSASAILWSNDGTVGTGNGGSLPEPSNALAQQIEDGVFFISVGDTTIPGMEQLDSAVMVSDTPLRLRVWFSDGLNGFQQLNPDQKLTDLTLNKLQTGVEDFIIYVNDETGNDANTGLTPETAKKTITGAVNIIPDKIRCNITVQIAPGVYREMVKPHGLSVAYGNTLKFVGDSDWTPSSGGSPSVIIDAADSGDAGVRDFCLYARQCTGLVFEGIAFQNALISGFKMENGTYVVNRCLAKGTQHSKLATGLGFRAGPLSEVRFNECGATDNESVGFEIDTSSRAYLTTCTAVRNDVGVYATSNSEAQFFEYNSFSDNNIGVQSSKMAAVSVWPSNSAATRTRIQNNSQYAVRINWEGQFTPADAIFSGNASMYSKFYGTIIGVDPQ